MLGGFLKAVITADDSGLMNGLRRAQTGLTGFVKQASQAGKDSRNALGETAKGADTAGKSIVQLSREESALSRAMAAASRAEREQARANTEVARTATEAARTEREQARTAESLSRAALNAAKAEKTLSGETRDAERGFTGASKAGTFFSGVLQHLAGNLLTQATNGVMALGKAAVQGFGDLEQGVANISTIKPTINTSQVFDALNEMQTRIPQSAKELGDSLYDVFSSVDVTQKEGLTLVEKFGKGAIGAGTDAKTFGTAVTGVMNAYKLSVKDADKISDQFFNTVNAGVVSGDQLAKGLGAVTAQAKNAGQSTESLFASIAAATKQGGEAPQNINNMANLFAKLTTKDAQKGFAELGVSVVDSTGKFKQIDSIVGEFITKTKGLSNKEVTDWKNKIFPDQQAQIGFSTLIGQFDTLKKQLKENATATGVSEKAYARMSGTMQSQSKLIANTFQAIATTIGSELLPVLSPLVKQFAKDLPGAIATVKTSLAPVTMWLGEVIGSAKRDFPAFLSEAKKAFEPIKPLVSDITDWFKENFPVIKQVVGTVLRTVGEFWKAHGTQIMGVVRPMVMGILSLISLVLKVINGDWKGAWKSFGDVVLNSFKLMSGLPNLIIGMLLDVQKRVGVAAKGIGAAIWQGLTGGLGGGHVEVSKAATALANTATGSAAKALDVRSPSRKFHYLGTQAVAGIVLGLLAGQSSVSAASEQLVGAATSGARRKLTDFEKQTKGFSDALKKSRAELAELLSGGDKEDGKIASRFNLIAQARRNELSGINDRIAGITKERQSTAAFTDELKRLHTEQVKAKYGENSKEYLRDQYPGKTDKGIAKIQAGRTEADRLGKAAGGKEAITNEMANLRTEIIRARFGEDSTEYLRRTLPFANDEAIAKIKAFRLELASLTDGSAASVDGLGAVAEIFGAMAQEKLSPASDALKEANRELLLLNQTTDAGRLAVSLYGEELAKLAPTVREAVQKASDAQGEAANKSGAMADVEEWKANQAAKVEGAKQSRVNFVRGIVEEGGKQSRAFFDAMLEGKGRVADFWKSVAGEGKKALIGMAWDKLIKPQIDRTFNALGESLAGSLQTTLRVTEGSVYKMLSYAQTLLSFMQGSGKKKKGSLLGGIIGAGIGFFTGGPAGALIGLQTGAAAGGSFAEGDILGGIVGAGMAYVGARGGPGEVFGSAGTPKTRSVHSRGMTSGGSYESSGGGNRSLSINVGTIHDKADANRVVRSAANMLEIGAVSPALI